MRGGRRNIASVVEIGGADMKYLLSVLMNMIILFMIDPLWAQDSVFRYLPKDGGAYSLKIHRTETDNKVQILVGIRKIGIDWGPFRILQLVHFGRNKQQLEILTLPASNEVNNTDILADFSVSGVLWFVRPMENGKLRVVRVKGLKILNQEIDLSRLANIRDLTFFNLRAVGDNEAWAFGKNGGYGVLMKLNGISNERVTAQLAESSELLSLLDVIPINQSEYMLIGGEFKSPKTKNMDIMTNLAITGPDFKVVKKRIQVEGLLQGAEVDKSGSIVVLTSTIFPGKLLAHISSGTLTNVKNVQLLEARSVTGKAFLGFHKNHLLSYVNNHGLCSIIATQLDTGQIKRIEHISFGSDLCFGLTAHQGGKDTVLGVTRWHLDGAIPIVSAEVIFRDLDELIQGSN